ncbi:multicopper oxidase domain-containing protein, partial [Fangia hongkongensis]
DTIDVLPHSSVTLEFDANNPGIWAFHCHLMYHLAAGMFTSINYAKVDPPQFYLNKIHMTKQQYDTWKKQNLSTSTE